MPQSTRTEQKKSNSRQQRTNWQNRLTRVVESSWPMRVYLSPIQTPQTLNLGHSLQSVELHQEDSIAYQVATLSDLEEGNVEVSGAGTACAPNHVNNVTVRHVEAAPSMT